MDLKRIRDARELLDKLPAEEWVSRYGRDLITAIERQAVGAAARGKIAAVAAEGAQLGRDAAKALRELETTFGGGDRERGRKLLTDHSGTLKPTRVRMAAAVQFYSAIRLYVLRWATGGVGSESPPAEPSAGTPRVSLQELLERVAEIELPDTATPEQRERVRVAQEVFREKMAELGLMAREPASKDDPAPDSTSDPGVN